MKRLTHPVDFSIVRKDETIVEERQGRGESEERGLLLERLSRIQRSISHHAPLQEVLDAITAGAAELLDDKSITGLRLIDPDDPGFMELVSNARLTADWLTMLARRPVGEGVGGAAINEDRLVVVHDYQSADIGVDVFKRQRLTAAMAAPVHGPRGVVGSLTVASFEPDRTYSRSEQEALVAFADHASLALRDARAMEAMREAQRSERMFTAMVTHDLKGPLTAILGILRTLEARQESLTAEQLAALLDGAVRRGNELVTLVDRLLQTSRAQLAGPQEHVSLRRLVADVVTGYGELCDLRVGRVPDYTVLIDETGVRIVLETLLENAVRHGTSGHPVEVGVAPDEDGLEIWVRNAGWLAEETRAALFQPFGHASPGGVGLGLSIAARLADAMGAHIPHGDAEGFVTFGLRLPASAVLELRHDYSSAAVSSQ